MSSAKVISADTLTALVQFLSDQLMHGDAKQAERLLEALKEEDRNDPHVVIVGSPLDGLSVRGPFTDPDAALEFAENELHSEWWTAKLEN